MKRKNKDWYRPAFVKGRLRKQYPIVERLENEEITTLATVVGFVVDDFGIKNGLETLAHVFELLNEENLKIWLAKVGEALEQGKPEIVIPNAVGFLIKSRKEWKEKQE